MKEGGSMKQSTHMRHSIFKALREDRTAGRRLSQGSNSGSLAPEHVCQTTTRYCFSCVNAAPGETMVNKAVSSLKEVVEICDVM